MLSLTDAILATLCYADIFNFPLSEAEIWYWLIGNSAPRKQVARILISNTKQQSSQFLFTLKNRKHIAAERLNNRPWVRQKDLLANPIARLLSRIPSVWLVGVTGGLAARNVKNNDDIDFLIVSAPGTMWVTRLVVVVLMELMGRRRRPGDRDVTDKLCFNMFMSRENMSLIPSQRDLFAAHEVLQMRPLSVKNGTYEEYLSANSWVKAYLPNAWVQRHSQWSVSTGDITPGHAAAISLGIARLLEPLAKAVQLRYMQHRRSTEFISASLLMFHPRDVRPMVKAELGKRLGRYKIPLDKVFYNPLK